MTYNKVYYAILSDYITFLFENDEKGINPKVFMEHISKVFVHHPSLSIKKYGSLYKIQKDLMKGNPISYSYYLEDVFSEFLLNMLLEDTIKQMKHYSYLNDKTERKIKYKQITFIVAKMIENVLDKILPLSKVEEYTRHDLCDYFDYSYCDIDSSLILHAMNKYTKNMDRIDSRRMERFTKRYNKERDENNGIREMDVFYDINDKIPTCSIIIKGDVKENLQEHISNGFRHEWYKKPKIGKNGDIQYSRKQEYFMVKIDMDEQKRFYDTRKLIEKYRRNNYSVKIHSDVYNNRLIDMKLIMEGEVK